MKRGSVFNCHTLLRRQFHSRNARWRDVDGVETPRPRPSPAERQSRGARPGGDWIQENTIANCGKGSPFEQEVRRVRTAARHRFLKRYVEKLMKEVHQHNQWGSLQRFKSLRSSTLGRSTRSTSETRRGSYCATQPNSEKADARFQHLVEGAKSDNLDPSMASEIFQQSTEHALGNKSMDGLRAEALRSVRPVELSVKLL